MPPKRKSKALAEASTPKPAHDDDAMDVDTPKDTPKASETPRANDTPSAAKPNQPPESEILGNLWTEDQTSSLFKAIIRWKPSGMHKHFRAIAISEHLRNHGFDPDIETHTRIPGIWKKLREFYDMDMIDERDNSFDYVRSLGGDEAPEEIYKDFELTPDDFHDLMWARAAATENEPDSWSDSDADTKKSVRSKRKRGDDSASVAGSATAKTRRASTIDDTEGDTPAASSPVGKSARGARSQKRAAAKAKPVESPESEQENEEEDEEDDDDSDSDDDEDNSDNEDEEEEAEVPPTTTRSTRGGTRGRGRGRGRGKGRKRG
ncbi:chromatin modification-related protein EAF7-domain-containing protein [Poronia punctata]|nr:chromatin modification-related protein EAF7-domain-containing protein [Poronia punctata]